MLQRLRKLLSGHRSATTKPGIPGGQRLYCIGDIHGRADLLVELHGKVMADATGFAGRKKILYLGDYIDRGTQSKQVIDLLLDMPLEGFESIFLKGNHEQALLDFLRYPEATASWLTFGGRETLYSYGLMPSHMPAMRDMQELATSLEQVLPEAHKEFFERGLLHYVSGDYYFVHAGIRPGIPLHKQHFEDQLWIRDEFTASTLDHGKVVVHGHTISSDVEIRDNRIGIDTGAFSTGILSCLVLEGQQQRLLQTGVAVS